MWPWYAAVAMVCFAAMQLVLKHLTRGMTSALILVFVFGFAWICYAAHVAALRTSLSLKASTLGLLIAAGVLSYLGNLFAVRAMALAPNPGYALAIASLNSLLVTLLSTVILGASLAWMKLLGVVLCVAGIALLVL
jgi:uncharacterized membrane protein